MSRSPDVSMPDRLQASQTVSLLRYKLDAFVYPASLTVIVPTPEITSSIFEFKF